MSDKKSGKKKNASELFPDGVDRLFSGDCLIAMRTLPSESIDLIYIDPPFFSGRNRDALSGETNELRSFSDIWESGMAEYLEWLGERLREMKRLLTPTGSIFVHLDWHAVHYVKCEMDKLFGCENFRNEIVWHYESGGRPARFFPRKHDTILWYTGSKNNWRNSDLFGAGYAPKPSYMEFVNCGGKHE